MLTSFASSQLQSRQRARVTLYKHVHLCSYIISYTKVHTELHSKLDMHKVYIVFSSH